MPRLCYCRCDPVCGLCDCAALQTVSDVYGKKLTNEQVAMYWNALRDRDIADVERRVSEYVKRGKFFPKPRDLRPIEAEQREVVEHDPKREAFWVAMDEQNKRHWDRVLAEQGDIGKLLAADALLARYSLTPEFEGHKDRMDYLRDRVATILRRVNVAEVLGDPRLRGLVHVLFGEGGIIRLQTRAAA